MSTTNHRMVMPGGAVVVRVDDEAGRRYHVHGTPALLTAGDVELLFADSIAGDGGRELCGCGICRCGHIQDTHGEESECRLCPCGLYMPALALRCPR